MIIEFDKSFSKSLDRLKDLVTKKRIERIIQDFDRADTIINIKNVKKLVGFKSYYRIRIGDYRLGIELKTPNIARFIRETQISKTECIEICKSNNPAESGGFNTPALWRIFGSRACPWVHTRDCNCSSKRHIQNIPVNKPACCRQVASVIANSKRKSQISNHKSVIANQISVGFEPQTP